MRATQYQVTDMHTAGEPVRIFTAGVPQLRGATLLEKRRDAMEHHDHMRRVLMREPRGHADMYGVWPTAPHNPDAALAVLFTHNGGYSTMCGHATIALGRWVLDQGLVAKQSPETRFILECPCGPVTVRVAVDADGHGGRVAFDSVPAFAAQLDAHLDVPDLGAVTVDIAYGGAFYAILPASRLGLDLRTSRYATLVDISRRITAAGREQLTIRHPQEPDLGFLYGTILIDDVAPGAAAPTYNLCVFGAGQVDRSATGSGITARMALDYARARIGVGVRREFRGISGVGFEGEIRQTSPDDDAGNAGIIVEVSGQANYAGEAQFTVEADDPLVDGLALPERLQQLWLNDV